MAWYRVVLPNAVAGMQTQDGIVVRAAPLLSWAIGERVGRVFRWIECHHGVVDSLAPDDGGEVGEAT